MSTPARLAGVGVFVVSGLVLFGVGLFMIGDRQMAFAHTFTVYTEFKTITGLQPGAIVRVSGAKAGTIDAIFAPATPNDKFRVQLDIVESLHQLVRTDSLATIETEGLVGGNYLGIGTGSSSAPRVAAGGSIAGKEPFDIADLMQRMGDTMTKVNATFDAVQGDVQRAVTAVADTVDSANVLITEIGVPAKDAAASVARFAAQTEQIAAGIHEGVGTVGKLVNDDELYNHVTAIAAHVQAVALNADRVVDSARLALDSLQAREGPIQGLTANVQQTMDDTRAAMAGFADNMDALKHNFLLRGFFKGRGYFDLAQISPADYRLGVLTKGGGRQVVRVWLRSDLLFEPDPGHPSHERLIEGGKRLVETALTPYLEHVQSGVVVVEGYAQRGPRAEQYVASRERASLVRNQLIGTFHLDPAATGAMPLGADSTGSPGNEPWDGVVLAIVLPKAAPSRGVRLPVEQVQAAAVRP